MKRNETMNKKGDSSVGYGIFDRGTISAILFFSFIAVFLYIFFLYVHPVVPWDGDDWGTMGVYITYARAGFPIKGDVESEKFFCSLLETLCSYIAAFVIYPLTGDYIRSFMIVNAAALSISITLTIVWIRKLLFRLTEDRRCSLLGCVLFLILAFSFYKTAQETASVYLYWQYNQCTTYYYSIPSYLASAFVLSLLLREIEGTAHYEANFRTGIYLLCWYCLNFSFLPAAILIAIFAFCMLVYHIAQRRSVKRVVQDFWFYWLILFGFLIKLILESTQKLTTGYFDVSQNMGQRIRDSFRYLFSTFGDLHPLFLWLCIASILTAFLLHVHKRKQQKEASFSTHIKAILLFLTMFVLLFIFFGMFGAISIRHLVRWGPRLDTLYVFYFTMIFLPVVSVLYVIKNWHPMVVLIPIIAVILFYVAVSPRQAYSDSYYTDSSPNQRYEIMSAIVQEAKRRDKADASGFIVHIPFAHYSHSMGMILYYHNVTDHVIPIQFISDTSFYFEDMEPT